MKRERPRVLILCADGATCRAYAEEVRAAGEVCELRFAEDAETVDALLLRLQPDVILLDESAVRPADEGDAGPGRLETATALLGMTAPVVVAAAPERQAELAALLARGETDFVARVGNFARVAAGLIERHLRGAESEAPAASQGDEPEEDFGEVLRHEVNNPLTGILGNAELLLADLRGRGDERWPQAARQRLETIAELAVRLRETVRRLSHEWEDRHDHARPA